MIGALVTVFNINMMMAWATKATEQQRPINMRSYTEVEREERLLPVDDPRTTLAATIALSKLRKLSESGIFETLELHKILNASEATGLFHHNTFLTVDLSSPYLKDSLDGLSRHDIILMQSLEIVDVEGLDDSSYTVAIDSFPTFQDSAIEVFWEEMVENHRQTREIFFQELIRDYDIDQPPKHSEL